VVNAELLELLFSKTLAKITKEALRGYNDASKIRISLHFDRVRDMDNASLYSLKEFADSGYIEKEIVTRFIHRKFDINEDEFDLGFVGGDDDDIKTKEEKKKKKKKNDNGIGDEDEKNDNGKNEKKEKKRKREEEEEEEEDNSKKDKKKKKQKQKKIDDNTESKK
jgi:hypothetical protein